MACDLPIVALMSRALADFSSFPIREFPEATPLLEEGQMPRELLILVEGTVEVSRDGIPITTVSQPGAVFGEMSLLLDRRVTATVRTVEASRLRIIAEPREALRRQPELLMHIARLLAARLDCMSGYLIDLKQQFQEMDGHLGMVDEMVHQLLHLPVPEPVRIQAREY